jgi:hypothetical protein
VVQVHLGPLSEDAPVAPAGPGSSVTVKTSWQVAGGIGQSSRTFAPFGLRKIQGEVLENLKKQVEGS